VVDLYREVEEAKDDLFRRLTQDREGELAFRASCCHHLAGIPAIQCVNSEHKTKNGFDGYDYDKS
jgi:hypothetical protein